MVPLRKNIYSEKFPFAIVSYWSGTATGVRMATLETAHFAHLYVPGLDGNYEGARFTVPDQIDTLRKVLSSLDFAFSLGRIHKENEIAAAMGVRLLRNGSAFCASRSDRRG